MLAPKWEQQYKVITSAHPNVYILEETQAKMLEHTFSANHSKKTLRFEGNTFYVMLEIYDILKSFKGLNLCHPL